MEDGPGYDFTLAPHRFADFADQCHRLQTSPESGFVRTTVCHRLTPEAVVSLRGAVLSVATASGVERRELADAVEYRATLEQRFGLHIPDTPILWERVWDRHQRWLQEQGQASAG